VDDLFSPSITTVVQPAYDIGFKAAQILPDRIEGTAEARAPIAVRLPATLKVRESSKVNREETYELQNTFRTYSRPERRL
jgi:LacI family transcriptional regulator